MKELLELLGPAAPLVFGALTLLLAGAGLMGMALFYFWFRNNLGIRQRAGDTARETAVEDPDEPPLLKRFNDQVLKIFLDAFKDNTAALHRLAESEQATASALTANGVILTDVKHELAERDRNLINALQNLNDRINELSRRIQ